MTVLAQLYEKATASRRCVRTTIELLSPCNLKCPHCYVTHSKKSRLTLPVLDDLFAQLEAHGAMYVTLTGGEIGLRKDLFDIIKKARDRYFAVTLISTGTLWQEREWDRLAELGVDWVRMSVYGVTDCVHDAVTLTPGSLQKTLASAKGLMERGISVGFQAPVMKTNAHEIGDLIDFAQAFGVELAVDPNITWTDASDPKTLATRADLETLVSVFSDPRVRSFTPADEACSTLDENQAPCAVGLASCFIQSTGDVLPCINWPQSGGNLTEQRFIDIWEQSEVFAFARGVTRKNLTTCSGCGDKSSCKPCAAMNLRETGQIGDASETICQSTAARRVANGLVSHQPRYAHLLPIASIS